MCETVAHRYLVGRARNINKDALESSAGKPAVDLLGNLDGIDAIRLDDDVRLEVSRQPVRQQRGDDRPCTRLQQWAIPRSIESAGELGGLRHERNDRVTATDAGPIILAHCFFE